jgi:CubicO group peptidase (beta-lactamase class C family)
MIRMKRWIVVIAMTLVGCGSAAGDDASAPGVTTHAPEPKPSPTISLAPTSTTNASTTGLAPLPETETPYPDPDWPTATPESQGLSTKQLDAAADVADANQSYCLLVIRHGMLVYERYFNGKDATSENKSWSIAKSYTSTLVGIAIARGEIKSLDESVSDFVSEWKGTDREAITIRNLVSMTSGLEWDAFEDYVSLATFATDDTAFAIDRDLADPPGSKWTYDNGSVQVIERVFREATGGSIEDYARAHLWSKIGSNASWAHDPSGNPTTYANVMATCRDHARLGYLFLHSGRWKREQVVPRAWVKETLTPSQTMNQAYGFLWWLNAETPALDAMSVAWPGRMVPFAPLDLFAARGFGNQFVDVVPSLDLIVVRFGADPETVFDPIKLAEDSRFATHDAILEPVLKAIE